MTIERSPRPASALVPTKSSIAAQLATWRALFAKGRRNRARAD